MTNLPTRTRSAENRQTRGLRPLVRLTAYAFLLQGVVFALLIVFLAGNLRFFVPTASVIWPEFLNELQAAPAQFLVIKALMLVLRTLYGVSMIGFALVWWRNNRSAAVLVLSFVLVSIPVINAAQLMGMALVPLASNYATAANINDTVAMAAIGASASAIYTVAEYLDTFVNVVPFIGLLASLFWLSTRVAGLERIKWILPLLIVLPFNKFLDLPPSLQLGAGLLNVVATGTYFFLMGWFILRGEYRDKR
ncbi:hypothetical protein [Roseibium sp. RKSG952]|uniref:hypothetical protein n=1 Tax=Roseibium sp. RKSG952 TaxID=2529384 RepID=UPI0012BD2562|nr:hypothetical protein [Roseibium sp. RKSG952]MTI00644.1 hypothetical protein [Roseibium sp. RKSG952]